MAWYVYILHCDTGLYYTGISKDVEKRHLDHKAKRGAKFTIRNGAGSVVYSEKCDNISHARKREAQIKSWSRRKKEMLINGKLTQSE